MKRIAELISIENNRPVSKSTDAEFWYQFQNSVLLALKQAGTLTEMQYRCAEEKISNKRRSFT